MDLKETIGIVGVVDIVLQDATTGQIKARRHVNNMVVQSGKDLIAANFAATSAESVTHIEVGGNDPVTAAANGQTALVDPHTPRVAATETVNSNPATLVYEAVFGPGVVTDSIGEAGLLTASTAGILVARTTFAAIPKGANDLLTITWTLVFG